MRITCCFLLLAALPLAAQTDQYEGFAGFWLENDRAEAFAITAPYPRVLAFRLKGGENPLHVSREYEYIGVRSWFFEPTQIPASGLPALQPATAEMTGARSVRLTAAPDDSSGLQLIMEVALDSERPVLQIRHGFKNMRTEKRRIACWALNVIRPDAGVGVVPWRSTGRRSLLFWPSTDPNESGIHLGSRARSTIGSSRKTAGTRSAPIATPVGSPLCGTETRSNLRSPTSPTPNTPKTAAR